jgi:excisionase family DNA binding protein|tara:strand:+ start:387 stop:620 length:234 start_codon:yes stop_codon:yes gene_type:complete
MPFREITAMPRDNTARFLVVKEVADVLRTSTAAIYAMVERGQLPGVTRVGRRILIHRDSLLDWLDESRVPLPGGTRR